MVNTLPCQVGVTPHKSEGIEPFNMVNTPPYQVEALPLHPINTPLGHLEDTSSPLILASVQIASHVPLVKSPSSSWSVTDPIAPMVSSVTSPLCHASPDTMSPPLKTTQAMSHEQPVDTLFGSEHPQSAFIEEVDDEDAFVTPLGPKLIGHTMVQHVDDPDPFNKPITPGQPRPSSMGNEPADVLPPDPNDDSIPPLGEPEHEFFGKTTPPSISLIRSAAFKCLIDKG